MPAATAIRSTCPRDCYDSCGILVKTFQSGEISVVGDPEHPLTHGALCGKCSIGYNGTWRDSNTRLLHPLKRIGPKGEGRFVQISWDAALSDIADRLLAIRQGHGGGAIYQTHYTGTCSLLAGVVPLRFFNAIGATEVDPDTVCNKAGHVALQLMYGESTRGFDTRTIDGTRCLMIWGANPSVSGPHVHEHWLGQTKAPLIVIDPIRHETAALADLHLQLYPGTDGALAFALLHVIRAAGKLDRVFLAAHTLGWDEIDSQLNTCTPAWGEEVTGVSAALIEKAALIYSDGPSLLWMGQGFQRQTFGGNAMRAVGLLPAATGNIGKYGAGFLYLNGWDTRGVDVNYLTATHFNTRPSPMVSHMDLVAHLEKDAEALVTWNNNIAASSPQQRRLRRALQRENLFQVTLELFMTDTAKFADYVLPAASFLEFDDIVMPYFNSCISAQTKAMPPMGQALPNQEIFRRLAKAMGLEASELFESDEKMIAKILSQAMPGLSFAQLSKVGTVFEPLKPAVQFADLTFKTASGKVELSSESFVASGLPRAPYPSQEPRPEGAQLRMISPASKWLMNSSFGNAPEIVKQLEAGEAFLHPDEARSRNLEGGTRIRLSNATGAIVLRLSISSDVPRGVVLAHKSRWATPQASENINALNPGAKADLAESCAVHSINVSIAPACVTAL